MATMWLMVTEFNDGPGYGHPYELWSRDVDLEHAPDVADEIMFLASDEEPDGSVSIQVKSRYWSLGGRLNLELRGIVHLPDELMEKRITEGIGAWQDTESCLRHVPMPWRAEDDEYGLLGDRLAGSGWLRWADRRDRSSSGE